MKAVKVKKIDVEEFRQAFLNIANADANKSYSGSMTTDDTNKSKPFLHSDIKEAWPKKYEIYGTSKKEDVENFFDFVKSNKEEVYTFYIEEILQIIEEEWCEAGYAFDGIKPYIKGDGFYEIHFKKEKSLKKLHNARSAIRNSEYSIANIAAVVAIVMLFLAPIFIALQ